MSMIPLIHKYPTVEYVLVGGFAMNLLGFSRQTGDIDILVKVSPENNIRWITALSTMPDGATAALSGVVDPFSPDNEELIEEGEDNKGVIRIHDAFVIDIMPKACGQSYEDLERHIIRTSHKGQAFNMLNPDGMLKTKQGVRPKDITDRNWLTFNYKRLMEILPEPISGNTNSNGFY